MMASACLTLYETSLDARWMRQARELADQLLRLFHDADGDGFFQTGSDAEALVVRPKELFDNAIPSGNSVAAETLQRLALLTGEVEYETAAVSALRPVRDLLPRAPSMFGTALGALDLYLSPARKWPSSATPPTRGPFAWFRRYGAGTSRTRFWPPPHPATRRRRPWCRRRPNPVDGRAAAYVCERFVCRRPVTEPAQLAADLEA